MKGRAIGGRAIGWLPEERAWIAARQDWPRRDLHAAFCAFWLRRDVRLGAFTSFCKREGLVTGRTGCFARGQESSNKGKAMTPEVRAKCASTMFRKGNVSHTARGAGHERICSKDGYVILIVAETNPWSGAATRPVHKHRWLWEKANGPVPEGMALKCLDGDRTNCDPSNWEAIPRGLLPRLNGRFGRGYDGAAPEVKPLIMAIAKLEHAARSARAGK